jgi:Zyg-11 protein homolog
LIATLLICLLLFTCSSTNSTSSTASSINFVPPNLRLLLKFTRLTSLNLSNTDVKNHCLDLIIDSLVHLDTLDLSVCRSLTTFHSLVKLSSKLKCLNLYNCTLHLQRTPTIYQIIYQLKFLEYLDISNDNPNNVPLNNVDYDVNKFLLEVDCLPNLKHFDISGQKTISSAALQHFLVSHGQLQFVGLFLTNEKYAHGLFNVADACYCRTRHYTYDLQDHISSTITEADVALYEPHLIESLKRYYDRSGFVQKILYYIFFLTRSYPSKNQILLLELILHTMSIHMNLTSVQMASTACIYNLTRTPLTEQINVRCLAKIVRAIIHVMELFPNQQQVMNKTSKFLFTMIDLCTFYCFSCKRIVF